MSRKRKSYFGRLMFGITLIALLIFNAYAMLDRRAAQTLFKNGQESRLWHDELESLSKDFGNPSNPMFNIQRELSHAIETQSISDEKLLATFDDEFLVLMQDLKDGSGTTNVRIYVPKHGKHRIRIELWLAEEPLMDESFDVESGARCDILFDITSESIETKFPGHEPLRCPLQNFDLEPGSKQFRLPPLFVSPNQIPWRKGIAFFDEIRTGVLSEFRFNGKKDDGSFESFESSNAVTVRVSAESTGPISASAADMLTVIRLMEMVAGRRPAQPYRHEHGRYIFE